MNTDKNIKTLIVKKPLHLDCGKTINNYPIALKKKGEHIKVDLSISPLLKECKHFIDCCKNRTIPITDGNEGVHVLKVLNSLQKSLESDDKFKYTTNNNII